MMLRMRSRGGMKLLRLELGSVVSSYWYIQDRTYWWLGCGNVFNAEQMGGSHIYSNWS